MNVHDPEQSVAKLLKLSGERGAPSAERMVQARIVARESWQRMLTQKNKAVWQRRWLKISLALVASVVGLLIISPRIASPPATIARVIALEGEVSVTAGAEVHAGQQLVTENGRVALVLGDSLSLRLDQHTTLHINDAGRVTLLRGRVYVDSGGLNAHAELCIVTPAGEVKHLGTQFQVSVQDQTTQVRVREGHVQLSSHSTDAQYIAAGEEVQVVGSRTRLQHGLAGYGADWEWATMIAPAFDIENRPLPEFLAWMAREHGWQLHYANEALQRHAQEIRLHGSLERMSSNDVLERVSLITGVPITSRDGVISVGVKKADQ
jgi:ferric-dicitrate binding protein FerR (iron transport regulator)